MIDQLTVFLGNEKGRLTALCEALGSARIQMHALAIADTTDYGIVRIICDRPKAAMEALKSEGFSASIARVVAVQVPDVPGGAAQVFAALDKCNVNIEYAYCFASQENAATLAMKADGDVASALEDAGFKVLYPGELYAE